jgi:hypothetical protein
MKTQCRHNIVAPEACRWMHNMHLRCTSFKGSGAKSIAHCFLDPRSTDYSEQRDQRSWIWNKTNQTNKKTQEPKKKLFLTLAVFILFQIYLHRRLPMARFVSDSILQPGILSPGCGLNSTANVWHLRAMSEGTAESLLRNCGFFFGLIGLACQYFLLSWKGNPWVKAQMTQMCSDVMLPVVEHEAVVLLPSWQLAYLTGNLQLGCELRTHDFAWFRMSLHDLIWFHIQNTITWEPMYHIQANTLHADTEKLLCSQPD